MKIRKIIAFAAIFSIILQKSSSFVLSFSTFSLENLWEFRIYFYLCDHVS